MQIRLGIKIAGLFWVRVPGKVGEADASHVARVGIIRGLLCGARVVVHIAIADHLIDLRQNC